MKPTVGRIVNYVSYGGAIWPALITRVHNATMLNVYVFPGDGSPATAVTKLRYSSEPKPNSWHWPVREEEEQSRRSGPRPQLPAMADLKPIPTDTIQLPPAQGTAEPPKV